MPPRVSCVPCAVAGEKIVREDDEGDAFFLIARGSAEVSRCPPSPSP